MLELGFRLGHEDSPWRTFGLVGLPESNVLRCPLKPFDSDASDEI